jgi:hypothetical protein
MVTCGVAKVRCCWRGSVRRHKNSWTRLGVFKVESVRTLALHVPDFLVQGQETETGSA